MTVAAGLATDILRGVLREVMTLRVYLTCLVAAGVTFLLAQLGIDAAINDLARLQEPNTSLFWSAFPMLAGLVMPLLVPAVLVFTGETKLAKTTFTAFSATLIIVSILKGVSSRVHPEAIHPIGTLAKSQVFRFGVLESGFSSLIEGWPSGHTATNGAVALVLAWSTPYRWLALCTWGWFVWVASATVFGINGDVHWLSDTIAGLLIASTVALQINSKTGKPHEQ